jgi:hypothetical protein
VAGIGVLAAEPSHVGGLTNQLGRGEHAAAVDRQQRGRAPVDVLFQLDLELDDLPVEFPTALHELAGEAGDDPVEAVDDHGGSGQVLGA